jgi:hypothetical protein
MVEESLGDQEKEPCSNPGRRSERLLPRPVPRGIPNAYCVDLIAEDRAELDGLRRALSKLWQGSPPTVRALTGEAVMVEVRELLRTRLPDLSEHDPVRVALTRVLPELEAVA